MGEERSEYSLESYSFTFFLLTDYQTESVGKQNHRGRQNNKQKVFSHGCDKTESPEKEEKRNKIAAATDTFFTNTQSKQDFSFFFRFATNKITTKVDFCDDPILIAMILVLSYPNASSSSEIVPKALLNRAEYSTSSPTAFKVGIKFVVATSFANWLHIKLVQIILPEMRIK